MRGYQNYWLQGAPGRPIEPFLMTEASLGLQLPAHVPLGKMPFPGLRAGTAHDHQVAAAHCEKNGAAVNPSLFALTLR